MSGEAHGDAPTGADEAAPTDGDSGITPDDAPGRSTRRRSRLGLLVRLFVAGLVGFALMAAGFVSQTATGQRMVLDELLDRVRGALIGQLTVGGIRSQTLVTGFTLTDVRLDAQGGRRVLDADSLVLRYSLLSVLVGSPQIRSATLHGLDLEVSRGPDDDALNVERIFPSGDNTDAAGTGRPSTIDLGRISIRGGTIVVLTPVEEAGPLSVSAPDGSPLRRLAFEGVDLDLEETVLRPGGPLALDARLTSFSGSVSIVEEPLIVQAAVGRVTFGAEGLRIEDGRFRLPGSLLDGGIRFGPERPGEAWSFAAGGRADDWGDLADLRWIEPRIPAGAFRGEAQLRTDQGLDLTLLDFEVQTGTSALVATGDVSFDDGLALSNLVVTASPLAVADMEPWLGRDVPLDGFVSGQATFSGTESTLHADGRLTLLPAGMGGAPTTADFSGTVFTGGNPGAEGVLVRLDPVNYRLIEAFWPGAEALAGGSAELEIDGRADEGILVVADVVHAADTASTSRLVGRGLFRRLESGTWTSDVQGDLTPLSLELVTRLRPELDLGGSVSGPVQLQGPMDDLRFEGDLAAGGGRLTVTGSIDLATLGASYAVEADAEAVSLVSFTDRVPEPTVVSGHVTMQASGSALDSLDGTASIAIRPSLVGPVRVSSASAEVRAGGGLLMVDTLDVDISGARIGGSGSLGMTATANGAARLAFEIDSLVSLRPMFMGDSILVSDGLSPLEQDLLRVRGIEPDTLPSELDVRMAGSVRGTAAVTGHFGDLGVELDFEALDIAYRHNEVESARVVMTGSGLPDMRGDWMASIRAQGIGWESRRFDGVDFDGTMSQRRGDGTLTVRRRPGEQYFATGAFALDSLGGELALAEGSAQIDDLSWELGGPSRIAWDTTSVRVDSLELRRVGGDPASVTAQGTLTRGGESNFRLDMEGFHIEDALRVLQREDIVASGHVDLSLTVVGPAESPSMDARFEVQDPRYGAFQLSRLSGSLEYRDRSSDFSVDLWDGDRNALSASGTLPLDLALTDVEQRTLDEPMDVQVTADSLGAGIALAYFQSLDDVAGTISADLDIGGTSRQPEPRGTIRLANGAWTIGALGVRHAGIEGELVLRPDRSVGVQVGTSVDGESTVSGVVTLDSIANPALDLVVSLEQFQTVNRRDIESMLSGSVTVRGRYRLPVVEGDLRVDQGTLFVEEFARSAAVVDLRDPGLFADGFAVDTTVFVTQPILAGLRNPFLDNLRANVGLTVPRDLWLRSGEMNVEIGGELIVRYDRAAGDLVMVGDLQALRGSYQILGRTFEVDGGTVSFLGQPGVNPSLAIEAVSRVRRRGGDRLEVRATVTGTLVQPLVTLSATEQGLSQSDLVSYLLFGVPGGDLGGGAAGAASGSGLGQDLGAGSATYLSGALGSQLGTALAQGVGFDYFAISQGDVLGSQDPLSNVFNSLSTAQVEVGRYLGEDVFVVFVLSRPSAQAASSTGVGVNFLRGVRVELALSEEWFVEGFIEDRFLRASGALGQTGLDGEEIVGLLVFREWGYGSQE